MMGAAPSYMVISAALVMLMTPIGMAIAVYRGGGVSSI
jgi:ammonia channel protein AmtB